MEVLFKSQMKGFLGNKNDIKNLQFKTQSDLALKMFMRKLTM